jgi:hypothetical protein
MDGELWVVSMTAARVTGIVVAMNTLDAHGFAYDACDIPADMTIAEFRARRGSARAGRWSVLTRLRRPLQVLRTRP